jgi:FtsZ-binding cell division protein ZapB
MVTMADLLETKKKRYIEPYIEYLKIVIEERKKAKKLAREQREARSLERKKLKEEKKATKKRDK